MYKIAIKFFHLGVIFQLGSIQLILCALTHPLIIMMICIQTQHHNKYISNFFIPFNMLLID